MKLPTRHPISVFPEVTTPHLWALFTLVTVFAFAGLTGIWLGDFWWHLRVGELIFSTRAIPATDQFSFTAQGAPYVYQQWLAELIMYLLFRLGDLQLVVVANMILLTALAGVVIRTAWETSGNLRVAAACTLVSAFVAMPNRDIRPQVFGFLFFALFYLILLRYRRGPGARLWLLPLIAAVWANVHGSVVLGLALCLIVLAAKLLKVAFGLGYAFPRRKMLGLAAATVVIPVAMLVNPLGIGLFGYIVAVERNPTVQSVIEWQAPSIRNPTDLPFFAALLVCIALFAVGPRALDLTEGLLFVVFAALALEASRNAVWLAIVAPPLAARQITLTMAHLKAIRAKGAGDPDRGAPKDKTRSSSSRVDHAARYGLAALLLAIGAMGLPWIKPHLPVSAQWRGLLAEETPIAAVRFIAERFPEERFFHPNLYGSYMLWASPSRPPVFVDARIELYSNVVWQDYWELSAARHWQELLAKYHIRHVLLPKWAREDLQRDLRLALEQAPDWQSVYEDNQAIVYAKVE